MVRLSGTQPFPEGGRITPVSTGPGTEAAWSRDGRELFYRIGNTVWAHYKNNFRLIEGLKCHTRSPVFGITKREVTKS